MFNAIYCEQGHYVEAGDTVYGDDMHGVMLRMDWDIPNIEVDENAGSRFCPECGSRTLRNCPQCKFPILYDDKRPNYCRQCGKQFPWTETALKAASEFTDELESISDEDKKALKGTFQPLTVDSAQTPLAASRFKRLLQKIGPATGDTLMKIIVNVASDAAKKLMGV